MREIVNETEFEVFALDAGLATATVAGPVLAEAISDAGTAATNWAGFNWVGPTYVVSNCVVVLPTVHCTTEQGRRFVPVTIREKPAAPAVALVWEREIFDGAGGDPAEIVKGSVLERTPELET